MLIVVEVHIRGYKNRCGIWSINS